MDKYCQNLSSSKHLITLVERAGIGNLGKEDGIKKCDKAKKKKNQFVFCNTFMALQIGTF